MRAGSLLGAFVTLAMTATIAAAAGQIMATALGAPGAGRFAAADLVARANPTVRLGHLAKTPTRSTCSAPRCCLRRRSHAPPRCPACAPPWAMLRSR